MTTMRWMLNRDLPDVARIDPAVDPEWTARHLRLRNGIGVILDGVDSMHDPMRDVIGFALYTLHARHLQVCRIAIDPDRRRRGYGSAVLAKLASKLNEHRRSELRSQVEDNDLAAHLFLRSCGFHGEVLPGTDHYLFRFRVPVREGARA